MAKSIDAKAKDYMRQPEIFADVFNYFFYGGAERLKPELLREQDSAELVLPFGKNGRTIGVQKYRDVLKHAVLMEDGKITYQLILGIENQTNVNYAMPVKNMIYDALNYGKQVTAIARAHREEENKNDAETSQKRTSAEFLSGLKKADRLLPVVTLVVYLGQDTWDGALNLHSLFCECDPDILQYVPDYKINLIEPASMSLDEISKFASNFRKLATIISCGKDAEKLNKTIKDNKEFEHLDKNTADLAFSVVDSRLKLRANKEGEINMCKAVDQLIEMGRAEGEAKGRVEGEIKGEVNGKIKLLYDLIKQNLVTSAQAAAQMNMTEKKFLQAGKKLGLSL